jgi:hypothetical protein
MNFFPYLILLSLGILSAPLQAAPQKEALVLMPLLVTAEDRSLQGMMETALVEGLQQEYKVYSGEQVQQKAKEIFKHLNFVAGKVNTGFIEEYFLG